MPDSRSDKLIWRVLIAIPVITLVVLAVKLLITDSHKELDPAAWGSDHVGQPIPEYVTGEQCLFCHREKIGATWAKNRHNLTIRDIDAASPAMRALSESAAKSLVKEIKYEMGNEKAQRFLKPAKEYGHLELLSVEWIPPRGNDPGKLMITQQPHWEASQYAASCSGCHMTAVDSKTLAFSALSIDCYACHGNVAAEHPNKPELAYLSHRRKDSAALITSICAQCHIRTGQSKSTGLPYPNTFVAGDNLFRDFKVNFSEAKIREQNRADRHVMENIRDVVMLGKESVTCLTCHDVHSQSSQKHRHLARSDYCAQCHNPNGSMIYVKPLSAHSNICGY